MNFSSFESPATAVVIGASGGIGQAIRQQLESSPVFGRVHAFSRSASNGSERIDFADEASIRDAAASINTPIDLVFVATGILHTDSLQPEKALRQLEPDAMLDVFRVNTLGPMIVAKHFLPKLRKDAKSVFAALSARVGSISDNRLGGWLSYRTSKAALNMALKTASVEHRRTHKRSAIIALHPGTVDTALSKPFQRGVPDGKLFDAAFAAWDGKPVDY